MSSQILLYQSEDGRTKLDVRLENQTVWLSQKQLTELFGKAKGTISEHVKHIFKDGELEPAATVRLFRTVQTEGTREVARDVILGVPSMILKLQDGWGIKFTINDKIGGRQVKTIENKEIVDS